jgi:hypothetical protein
MSGKESRCFLGKILKILIIAASAIYVLFNCLGDSIGGVERLSCLP